MSTFCHTAHGFLFLEIIVNQTISSTLKCVVSGVWPNRIISAIKWEENLRNVFNVHGTLCLVTLTGSVRSHGKRIINICLHSIDQVELYYLETSYSCTYVILNQKFTLRIIDNHVVRTFFTHPHINRRLNNSLTFTGTGDSEYHCINRRRIYNIDTSRSLRLIQRKFPVVVN